MKKALILLMIIVLTLSYKVKANTFEPFTNNMYFGTSNTVIPYSSNYDMFIVDVADTMQSVFYFSFLKNALVDQTQGPTIPSGTNYVYFRGYIKAYGLADYDIQCQQITSNGCEGWRLNNKFNFSLQLGQWTSGSSYPVSSCYLTQYNIDHSENGVSFIAKCPVYKNTQKLQYVRFNWNRDVNQKSVTMGLYMEYIEKDSTNEIINNQNENTDRIQSELNQTQTYTEDMNTNMTGVNETVEYSTQEQNLKSQLDLNTSMLDDLYIDSSTSGFIWDLVGGLRNMNPAIITLMSTMLGLGVIRLILNR